MDSKYYIENLDFNIYEYTNTKDLLEGYIKACKQKDRKISMLQISQELELRSQGGFQRLLEQKNLAKYLPRLRFLMNLNEHQWEFLSLLSSIENESKESKYYTLYQKRLDEVLYKTGNQSISEAQLKVANSWWHFVILQMATLKDSKLEVEWFLKNMNKILRDFISEEMGEDQVNFIKNIIDDLKKAGLIQEQNGKVIIKEDFKLLRLSRNFYIEQFDVAKRCLYDSPERRRFRGFLYPTTYEKFKLFKKKIMDQLCEEMDQTLKTSTEQAELLASIDFSLFQLSESPNQDRES